MIVSKDAPQQHKQPSRKGKKAWRKNVDVTEVQEGLEIFREEVIDGGIVAEKPSEALFTLDTAGSEAIKKSYRRLHKPLKADQILAQRSAVPCLDGRKRPGVTDGVLEPSSKKRKTNGVSRKEYERLRNRAYGGESIVQDIVKTDEVPEHDPWAERDEETLDPKFSYLDKRKPIRAPNTIKEAPISLLIGARVMPAVVHPKAGISYNPDFQDWRELLIKEGSKEVDAERLRIREKIAEEERLAKIAAAQSEPDNLQTEDESVWEGIESEYEGAEWLKKRRPERKTPAQRNKIKRRKAAEGQAKHDAEMKKVLRQALEIGAIAKQLEAQAAAKVREIIQEDQSSDSEIDDRVLRRRKLGKTLLPERDLELVLPDELRESLRLLKPEGNLLKDRFRNILIQGKVETRKPIQQPKKKRRTLTEKWTYKDFTVSA